MFLAFLTDIGPKAQQNKQEGGVGKIKKIGKIMLTFSGVLNRIAMLGNIKTQDL